MTTRIANVVSILIVSLALVFVLRSWLADDEGTAAAFPEFDRVSPEFLKAAGSGHWIGPVDARVILVLYSDYWCSFCREFDRQLRVVRNRYPEHLAVVVKPFVTLDTSASTKFFLAAECAAEQGVFEAYHTWSMAMLQTNERTDWTAVADSVDVPNRAEFDQCVLTARLGNRIQGYYDEGVGLGVRAVPTSFINGYAYEGSMELSALDSAVARAMGRNAGLPQAR